MKYYILYGWIWLNKDRNNNLVLVIILIYTDSMEIKVLMFNREKYWTGRDYNQNILLWHKKNEAEKYNVCTADRFTAL